MRARSGLQEAEAMHKLLWPTCAAVALHAALLGAYVAALGGDVSALVCVAAKRAGRPPYEAITARFNTKGYDGQFYYALARNPWQKFPPGIDWAAVRQLRFLYPALCWALSAGSARLLLWVMPLVNLAAIGGLAWLGGRFALGRGLSAWWGFLLPLAVNVGMPALRDLTDPVSTLAVFGLLAAWLGGARAWGVALWAAAAVFSREQNVAVVGILLVAAAGGRKRVVAAGLAAVLLLWLGWVAGLRAVDGRWPFPPLRSSFLVHHRLAVPLGGMTERWRHPGSSFRSAAASAVYWVGIMHVMAQLLLALYVAPLVKSQRVLFAFLLLGAALVALGGSYLYWDRWSLTRVFVWLPMGVWLGSVLTRRPWPVVVLAAGVFWPLSSIAWAWAHWAGRLVVRQ
jgi:hypothetical protein